MNKEEFYANARTDLTGPIQGITVLDATTTWAGPMAACVLADLGADVLKIEHPAGDVGRRLLPMLPERALGVASETVNRNKRCISLDMKTPEGKKLFLKLAETADVIIENFKPGTTAGWGVGYGDVAKVNPSAVYVSISGFGQFGPLSPLPGYDPVAQNFSGWSSLNGEPGLGPTKAPTYLGDDLSGLHGAIGALAALRHRDSTGEGQHVDVALVDSVIFQSNGNLTSGALDIPLNRWGNQFSFATPVNIFETKDGHVFAGVLLDTHWVEMCSMINREELAELTLMQRMEQRELVNTALADWCATKTTKQITDDCAKRGLPATAVNTFADAARHEHVHARDMLQEVELSDGSSAPITGPAVKFSRTPTTIRNRAPAQGENNEDVLTSLGYSSEQIAELKEHGVI